MLRRFKSNFKLQPSWKSSISCKFSKQLLNPNLIIYINVLKNCFIHFFHLKWTTDSIKVGFFFFLILLKLTEKSVGRTIFTELFCNRRLLTSSYSNTICLLQVCQPPLPVDTHITMTKLHHQKQEQLKDIVQDKVLEFLFFTFYQRCKDCQDTTNGNTIPKEHEAGKGCQSVTPSDRDQKNTWTTHPKQVCPEHTLQHQWGISPEERYCPHRHREFQA